MIIYVRAREFTHNNGHISPQLHGTPMGMISQQYGADLTTIAKHTGFAMRSLHRDEQNPT